MRRDQAARIAPRTARRVEWTLIATALLGLGCMVQPFTHAVFLVGFWLLFVAGILYVSTTFWPRDSVTWRVITTTLVWVVGVLGVVIVVSILIAPMML